MKHIKTFEKLGVPENITETGEQIYNLIIQELKKLNKNIKLPDNDEIEINIRDKFIISDYKFNTINTILTFKETNLDTVKIYSYGFNFQVQQSNKPKFMTFAGNYNKVNLIIETAIPKNDTIKLSEFITYLENDELALNSLTHELSHAYEKYKKPEESIPNRINYEVNKELRMNIKPIDDFAHILYFISEIENNVRPSEVAADLKKQNITKSQFKSFLENNEVYQKLLKAKTFSYEKLKNDLIDNIDTVTEFLENHNGLYKNMPTTDIEKVNIILKTYYSTSINLKLRNIVSALQLDLPFYLQDFEEREDIHNKYAKKITKQKNYDKFFEFEEKRINFTADKMIKKIHKLYDMAKDDNTTKTTKEIKEIKDWELYHKIKKTPEPEFTTEIKKYKFTKKKNK